MTVPVVPRTQVGTVRILGTTAAQEGVSKKQKWGVWSDVARLPLLAQE